MAQQGLSSIDHQSAKEQVLESPNNVSAEASQYHTKSGEGKCKAQAVSIAIKDEEISLSSFKEGQQSFESPDNVLITSDKFAEASQHSAKSGEGKCSTQAMQLAKRDEDTAQNIRKKLISTMHQALAHITVYCNNCKETKAAKIEVESTLSALLLEIHSQFGNVKKQLILQEVVECIVNLSDIVQALCTFIECAFGRLGNPGLPQKMAASLLFVEQWFWDFSQINGSFCDMISQKGMILHFFYQLGELRKNTTHIDAVRELMLISIGILNSFAIRSKYHSQFFDIDYYKVFTPYIYSPLKQLRISSLFTFSYLVETIPEEDIHFLAMEQTEVEEIVQELGLSASTNEIHLSNLVFSTVEVLEALKNLAVLPQNSNLIVSSNVLMILAELYQSMSGEVRQQILLLLLKLSHLMSKSVFKTVLSQIVPTSLPEMELKASIEFTIHNGSEGVVAMKTCYRHHEYERCTEIFEVIKPVLSDSSVEESKIAKLLYAKALFHFYKKELRSLSKYSNDKKKYKLRHTSCYLKVKEVILMLGTALDYKYLDCEGSKYLDLSMIDYASETNNLKSCKRCVLCRNKAPLKRSHLWPESLLKLYKSGVDSPANHKLFYKIGEDGTLSTFSPHQLSYWMFCSDCEQLLCKHGETQCVPLIKDYIYDESDPNSSSRHLHIRYKECLYYFCIGLVFRGLVSPDPHVSITAFTNEDEIYELLLLCRRALLNLKEMEEIPGNFQVAILFTPTSLQKDEKHSGFINSLLTSFGLFALSDACLTDGSVCKPREAQFFLAHCGVFNVVVPLGRSHGADFPQECVLIPKRGTYSIPPGDERIRLIPPGIMTYFRLLADCSEINFLQKPKKLEDLNWTEPLSEKKDVIGSDAALDEDIEQTGGVIRPSWMSSNPKVLMFLPHGFQIQRPFHRPSSVVVPSGHKILLHHTFAKENDQFTSTIFLAIGSSKEYPKHSPYIIYHRSDEQGVQINSGFYFSPETLSATTFLPDSLEKCLTSYFNEKESGKVKTEIKHMLQKKGFESIYSVLLHSESSSNRVFDMKCHPRRCWYCRDLCEFCMQLCVVGCEIVDHTPHGHCMYTFCSLCWKDIQLLKSESSTSWPILAFLAHDKDKYDDKLFPSHSTLLTLKCSFDPFDHLTLSICTGHEIGPFIMTQVRNLAHQDCAECLISEDCSPTEPLPYCNICKNKLSGDSSPNEALPYDCNNCKRMQGKISSLRVEGLIQSILNHVLMSKEAKETKNVLDAYFSGSDKPNRGL